MDQKEGYAYAKERGLIEDSPTEFYKLFKSVARLTDITSTEKIVLTIILSYTNSGLEFFMSNKNLSEEMGMDKTSIIRAVDSLRDREYVETYYKYKEGKMVGRIVTPIKEVVNKGVKHTFDNIKYIKYDKTTTKPVIDEGFF